MKRIKFTFLTFGTELITQELFQACLAWIYPYKPLNNSLVVKSKRTGARDRGVLFSDEVRLCRGGKTPYIFPQRAPYKSIPGCKI